MMPASAPTSRWGSPVVRKIDYFRSSVALSGDTALIGAQNDEEELGAAYVFVGSGSAWEQQHKRTASDPAQYDYFGYSVALSGDIALVGAAGDAANADLPGSAYVFELLAENADPCTDGLDCISGYCSDGVCCDAACDGECDMCLAAEGAPADGQ